jgi:hypothetical protein
LELRFKTTLVITLVRLKDNFGIILLQVHFSLDQLQQLELGLLVVNLNTARFELGGVGIQTAALALVDLMEQ